MSKYKDRLSSYKHVSFEKLKSGDNIVLMPYSIGMLLGTVEGTVTDSLGYQIIVLDTKGKTPVSQDLEQVPLAAIEDGFMPKWTLGKTIVSVEELQETLGGIFIKE